jgi:hypothetical protein
MSSKQMSIFALSSLAIFLGSSHPAMAHQSAAEADKIDLIIVVDTSPSMNLPNSELMDSLYSGLVQPMTQVGIDLRTIVIGKFGANSPQLCFEQPLGAIPFGACDFSPPEPANTPEFKHYSVEVQSLDAWCILLESFDGSLADDFAQATDGWSVWLRPDAFKKILVMTDDRVQCTHDGETYTGLGDFPDAAEDSAAAFDAALQALSTDQFGTPSARNYMFMAAHGVSANPNRPDGAWMPPEPFGFFQACSPATHTGWSYQALTITTNGFRYPICSYRLNPQPFYDLVRDHPRIFADRLE